MKYEKPCWIGLALVLTAFCPLSETKHTLSIDVDAVRGNDSLCVKEGPCKTLLKAEELVRRYGNVIEMTIHSNITLNSVFTVSNSSNLTIGGSKRGPFNLSHIKCSPGSAGFIMKNVHNLSIQNLALVNCTASDGSQNNRRYRSAVIIAFSSQIMIRNVRFENSSNTALVLINNTNMIMLDNTSFVHNYPKNRKKKVPTSHPGAVSIQQNLDDIAETVQYIIVNSVFHYNQSPETSVSTSDDSNFVDRGYGGAMFVEFGGSTSHSSLHIEGSNFTDNAATRGGAVYAYFKDSARDNAIHISGSKFQGNHVDISGGGLNLGSYNSPASRNVYSITDCIISNNTALFGAGMAIYSIYSNHELVTNSTAFSIANTIFKKNSAPLSSAVDITPITTNAGQQGFLPNPKFTNCSFENHHSQLEQRFGRTSHNNIGVFSVTQFRVIFGRHTTFTNNSFSALLLESGIAEFELGSTILFENNTGFNGGAVTLYGFSSIVFNANTTVTFLRNHARNYGGAIFHQSSDQHSFVKGHSSCFLQNKLLEVNKSTIQSINVSFLNNTSGNGGTAVYASGFSSCHAKCRRLHLLTFNRGFKHSQVFNCIGNFTFSPANNKSLQSLGRSFTFHKSGKGQAAFSFSSFPGKSISLPFNVTDDFRQIVNPLMSVTNQVSSSTEVQVRDQYILTNKIVPIGRPRTSSMFTLTAVGVREIYFPFKITLLPCPPGYHIENDVCRCASGTPGYKDISKCVDSKFHAKYKGDLYVGYIPNQNDSDFKDLYFAPCSFPVCNANTYHLPSKRSELTASICALHRTGIMCGKCENGYSTYYHSRTYTCGPDRYCHLGALFYLLSEITPMVMFFIVVVTFDFSFTSGTSVGFIFFTQYLDHLTVHVNSIFSYARAPYRFFYGLFNFEFFHLDRLSFCLWTNAQILDIIVVKYITVVIALAIVLVFIYSMRYNSCKKLCGFRKRISAKISVVHGLSAFLVICYSQCTRTSFYILRYSDPVGYNGKRIGLYSYYGGLPYFKEAHLVYAIPAVISLVVVTILPPLVLLLYPLSLQLLSLARLSEHWLVDKTLNFTGINKLKPFIDCFQGCYKDNLRFFAGLYFVYRVAILMAFTSSANSLFFSVYSQLLSVVFLGIHCAVQPYKKTLHNTIDSLVFFNIALINGCVIISKLWINVLDDPNTVKTDSWILIISAFQLLLLYLPMVVALTYLMRKFCKRCFKRNSGSSITEVCNILEPIPEECNLLGSRNNSIETNCETLHEATDYGSMQDTY